MWKKLLAIVAMLYAVAAFAAVDVNKATAAELDGIKGIGPSISTKIVDERKKGNFRDWNDFIERVKGIGEGNAAKFSTEGMTVNGAGFKGAAAAKTDTKAAASVAPAAAAAAASPAAPAAKTDKADAKAEAKMKADEAKKAKAEAKAKKAEEAKAKKDAAKQAAADKKNAKADAPSAAASAVKK